MVNFQFAIALAPGQSPLPLTLFAIFAKSSPPVIGENSAIAWGPGEGHERHACNRRTGCARPHRTRTTRLEPALAGAYILLRPDSLPRRGDQLIIPRRNARGPVQRRFAPPSRRSARRRRSAPVD